MSDPLDWLDAALADLHADDLLRERKVRGLRADAPAGDPSAEDRSPAAVVNFSSNDYLGLAAGVDPTIRAAIDKCLAEEGFGSGASPLVTGRTQTHAHLEGEIADWKQTQAAILFPTGFAANAGTIPTIVGEGDVVFSDARNHASIIDGCRLSRATLAIYPHLDLKELDALLRAGADARRKLIVTDSLFSMDGDLAPLADVASLADQHGAMLMVDEAHATGVFGDTGSGLVEACGVKDRVDIQVGTLSKAIGSLGGFVAGRQTLIDWLANKARSYVFSTATPAVTAAAALAAIRWIRTEPSHGKTLLATAADLRDRLRAKGLDVRGESQIIPVIIGDAAKAVAAARDLLEQGLLVPAIRPPSVPTGESLLRISLCRQHSAGDREKLIEAMAGRFGE